MRFVNSPAGLAARLRGANAKVLRGAEVRRGDLVRVLPAGEAQTQPPA